MRFLLPVPSICLILCCPGVNGLAALDEGGFVSALVAAAAVDHAVGLQRIVGIFL